MKTEIISKFTTGMFAFLLVASLFVTPAAASSDSLTINGNLRVDSGEVIFYLDAGPANALKKYILLGTEAGTFPGTTLPGGLTLPLNWGILTDTLLGLVNTPACQNFMGTLDANGQATAVLNIGPQSLDNLEQTFHFAFCTYNPYDFVSNAVKVEVISTKHALIVCGNDIEPNPLYNQQINFENQADDVYSMLINYGYHKDQIHYLHPGVGFGMGPLEADAQTTEGNIMGRLNTIYDAIYNNGDYYQADLDATVIFVYFVGIGQAFPTQNYGAFLFDIHSYGGQGGTYEKLSNKKFFGAGVDIGYYHFDDNILAVSDAQLVSVMEFRHAGYFAPEYQLYDDGVILISSTDESHLANSHGSESYPAFSWVFFNEIVNNNQSVEDAFNLANQQIDFWNQNPPYPEWALQEPRLVDKDLNNLFYLQN